MTQVEQKIERLQSMIGFDNSDRFEQQIASAISDLADSLETSFLDNDTKVTYATHVFAKMLDDLADIVDKPMLLN